MKIRIVIVLIIVLSVNLLAQTKFYIYFKDKGAASFGKLSKSSALFAAAEKELTPAAIERRKQVMGDDYITYEDIPINENYTKQIESIGVKIVNNLKWFNSVTSYLTDEQIKKILQLPFVEKIEKVRTATPKDPIESKVNSFQKSTPSVQSTTGLNYGQSLNQNNLSDIPAVHDLGFTGKGVLIGMLDTGFRWKNHPALKNLKIIAEKDFVQNDFVTENQAGDATSQDSHGTNCLGLMSGYDPGFLIGPAFEASIILAKTENVSSETKVEEDNYAAAIQWMEGLGVQITTSSLGYNLFDNGIGDYPWTSFDGKTTVTAKALNLAFDRGVSTLTAAGNERGNSWGKIITPGDAINVITVGAVDVGNRIANFSSPGPTYDKRIKPEVVAFGVSNYISRPGGTYGSGSGTSFATPIAAGIAGILKSAWPHLTNVQIREIFLNCGDNTATPNNDRGWGLISALRVVTYPNFSITSRGYKLNKIFSDVKTMNLANAKVTYKIDNANYISLPMSVENSLKHYAVIPDLNPSTKVEFYFTYTKEGKEIREPVSGFYVINNFQNIGVEIPVNFNLYQNYPNPFNPSTTILFAIDNFGFAQVKVYNILGEEIATIVNELKRPGAYNIIFNADKYGLTSGVYFYSLSFDGVTQFKKMIFIK